MQPVPFTSRVPSFLKRLRTDEPSDQVRYDKGAADIEFHAFRAVCEMMYGDHKTDEEHHALFLKARAQCKPLYSYWKQTSFHQGASFADKL